MIGRAPMFCSTRFFSFVKETADRQRKKAACLCSLKKKKKKGFIFCCFPPHQFSCFPPITAADTCWIWMVRGDASIPDETGCHFQIIQKDSCSRYWPSQPLPRDPWVTSLKHNYTPAVGGLFSPIQGHVNMWSMEPRSLWLVDELFYPSLSGEREELEEVIELEFNYCSHEQEVFWLRYEESWAAFSTHVCRHTGRASQFSQLIKYRFCLLCSLGSEG